MANRDFEMEMRMKADFQSADRALAKTDQNVQRIVEATKQANQELAQTGQGKTDAGGTGQQAAANDNVTASLQRTAQARQALDNASRLTQQAIAGEIRSISELQDRLERGASSMDDLADTEALLDRAMSKGLITAEEYDEALGKLSEEQERLDAASTKGARTLDTTVGRYDKASAGLQRLQRDEAALKTAVDQGRISREQYNRAMAGIAAERTRLTQLRDGATQSANSMRQLSLETAGAQRNLTQMLVYAGSGQWELAGSQILQMGNQAGLAGQLFSGAGLAIGGVLAVLGLATFALAQHYLQWRALDTAILASGNSAGVTTGELEELRNRVGSVAGAYSDAQEAIVALTQSGRVSGEVLDEAATAAVNLSELTGRSIQETTNEIIALAKSPTSALLELNDKYHFLTEEVYANVASLEEQGRTQEAVAVAMEALARASEQRTQEMREHAGALEGAWDNVRAMVARTKQAILDAGRTDAAYRVSAGERGISLRQQQIADLREEVQLGFRSREEAERRIAVLQRGIAAERTSVDQWKQRADAQERSTKAAAEEQKIQDQAIRARSEIDKQLATGDKKIAQQRDLNRLIEQYNVISVANPNDSRLFDGSFDTLQKQILDKYKERSRRPRAAEKSDAQRAEEAAARELENLEKQVALLAEVGEGEDKVAEAARIRYEVEEGAYKNASEATKQALIDQAQLLDSGRAEVESKKELKRIIEETKRSYEQLHDTLRTPAEVAVEDAIDRVELLNKALEKGIINKQQLDADMARVVGDITDESPKFEGIAPEVGGVSSEVGRWAEAAQEEQKWYQDSLARLAEFRRQKSDQAAIADAEELRVKARHEANLRQLEQARQQLTLSAASDFFGQLSQLQRSENSKIATIGKAAAIAQAMINTYQAATAAYASLASIPYVGPALGAAAAAAAVAAGLANVAQIRAQPTAYADGGHVRGPGTSKSDSINASLSDYEFVTRAAVVRQPGALAFLERFNRTGMDALYAWRGFADGGLFSEAGSAPGMASPNWAEQSPLAGRGATQNRMRVYVLQDIDQLAEKLAQHPRMEKLVVSTAGQNGRAIQAEWVS